MYCTRGSVSRGGTTQKCIGKWHKRATAITQKCRVTAHKMMTALFDEVRKITTEQGVTYQPTSSDGCHAPRVCRVKDLGDIATGGASGRWQLPPVGTAVHKTMPMSIQRDSDTTHEPHGELMNFVPKIVHYGSEVEALKARHGSETIMQGIVGITAYNLPPTARASTIIGGPRCR